MSVWLSPKPSHSLGPFSSIKMKIEKEVYGTYGVLRIVGNPQESILFLKDKPIHYSWFAEIGSTWRYHIAQGLETKLVNNNKEVDRILKKGIESEWEFLFTCEYFSEFLTYGNYSFGLYELFTGIYMTTVPQSNSFVSYDYYGGMLDFTATQRNLDDSIVNDYYTQILKGGNPAMVLLHVENSPMFFVLDGHHKFLAYGKSKRPPIALIITKIGNEYKSIDYTKKIASTMKCEEKRYIERMEEEKNRISNYKSKTIKLEELFTLININENN